jgi:hypothetical protein
VPEHPATTLSRSYRGLSAPGRSRQRAHVAAGPLDVFIGGSARKLALGQLRLGRGLRLNGVHG